MQSSYLRNGDDNCRADPIQGHRASQRSLSYPVKSSVVTLDEQAEERAGWMESPGAVQILAEHSHPEMGTKSGHCVWVLN